MRFSSFTASYACSVEAAAVMHDGGEPDIFIVP